MSLFEGLSLQGLRVQTPTQNTTTGEQDMLLNLAWDRCWLLFFFPYNAVEHIHMDRNSNNRKMSSNGGFIQCSLTLHNWMWFKKYSHSLLPQIVKILVPDTSKSFYCFMYLIVTYSHNLKKKSFGHSWTVYQNSSWKMWLYVQKAKAKKAIFLGT